MDEELKKYLERIENRLGGIENSLAPMEQHLGGLARRVASMEQHLEGLENHFVEHIETRLADLENRLVEKMREMQTELLRGFEAFSSGQTIRLRKVEADQSNLDASLRGRVDVLETRLTQIELRLGRLAS